jgi:3-hydroxyisobutyrate dehydrogenase-like beta-hydroxyacid dehydrogenase
VSSLPIVTSVIGAGRMGSGVIHTLLEKGYQVTAYDNSKEAMELVQKSGAVAAESVEAAVEKSDFIFLSLPGPVQVREIVAQITKVIPIGKKFIIDLSTIDPKSSKDMAELCDSAGFTYIEAPVSGGPKGAHSGTMSIMVAAEEEDYKQIEPLLQDIGKSIFYLGQSGTASLAKICNNIVVAATASILNEAFILASAGGISSDKLKEILENSVGGSRTLDVFGPHMVSGSFSEPTFALGLMHKDLGLFIDASKQFNVTLFMGSLVYQIYNGAMAQGWEQEDHTVVQRYLERIGNKHIER